MNLEPTEKDIAMSSKNSSQSGGIGFVGLLTVVFITLKLCKVIAWSWLWVLSPIWLTVLSVMGLLVVFGLITVAALAVSKR